MEKLEIRVINASIDKFISMKKPNNQPTNKERDKERNKQKYINT